MKGITFYLEYPTQADKRKATVKNIGNHSGNCIAVINGTMYGANMQMDAIAALTDTPNSQICLTGVTYDYLRERCKRIPERMVKDIHPELHNRLLNN